MNVGGNGDRDLREQSRRLQNGNKWIKDAVVSGEQNLVEEDVLKVNGFAENAKDGHGGALQAPSTLQITQQQQSQGAMVCWERFLHLRSLKVLLVEKDDSTRHVVTALLRNCSYEVIEAANGLQAWKILEDLSNHIDLVLTEVILPCLSGIGLLCKIMSHKTRKTVPIIMMSSHDSMGLVFKCLSKGAVDFLVKPVRKNELKNLWQHVWRRCHSSSSSGSESGTQTQKSIKSRSLDKSDNSTGSNGEDDNGSIGLNVGDGSDNGSGTQSSWTKQAVEVDSPHPVSPRDQVAECPDSTCAQVIHSNAEISGNKQVVVTAVKEHQEQEAQVEKVSIGKDLDIGVPRHLVLQLEYPVEDPINFVGKKRSVLLERGSSKFDEQIDKGQLDLKHENPSSKLKYEAANMTGITTTTVPHVVISELQVPNRDTDFSDVKNKATSDAKELPSLELGTKRLRGVKDVGAPWDDRNVLRRSDSSAFSRYNTASNACKAPGGDIKSSSQGDTNLDLIKKCLVCDPQSHSDGNHPNQCSNMGSSNMDMGPTTNNTFTKSLVLKQKSAVAFTGKCLNPPSTFQPMKGGLPCGPQQIVSERADNMANTSMLTQPNDTHQELQSWQLTRHYDHVYLLHNVQQQHQLLQLPPDHDDISLKKMTAAAPPCGSSNVLDGTVEGNAGNHIIYESASGSNHGSNGQNGSSTAVNVGGINMESDNGIAGKNGSGDASGSGSGSGNRVEQKKFTQREAALTKFRQKRQERCFRKKVRYQSRKRLAEQRPRIRGQFVRQTANENASRTTEREPI